MLSLLLTLLVVVIVAGVLYWAVTALAGAFGLPPQVTVVLQVLVVVAILFILLTLLGPQVKRALG